MATGIAMGPLVGIGVGVEGIWANFLGSKIFIRLLFLSGLGMVCRWLCSVNQCRAVLSK
jgi:hypothetical protein